MYQRDEILANVLLFLQQYSLKPELVYVTAGAAVTVHGLRESTPDIDVYVPSVIFDRLQSFMYQKKYYKGGYSLEFPNGISVHSHDINSPLDITIVDGVSVYSLDQCLKQYRSMNRPKDQVWIQMLQSHPDQQKAPV